MTAPNTLRLFEGYGIELEYMIVSIDGLQTLPISDKALRELAGEDTTEVELGEIAWSNELAMHVIELKSNGPKHDLLKLKADMQQAVRNLNTVLAKFGARLLPTAMHPFFNPDTDLKLWVHENKEIYATYDRIFSCKGHGWANLQAIHINLPFANDDEFGRLHAAVRTVLPLLPAVAAASPIVEGKLGPILDNRVAFYLKNQRRIATIIGSGIPEAVNSEREYNDIILKPMYRDISTYDPKGQLQHEWLNSRAAIARFERHAIEIRLLDIQESLSGDFAIITAVVALVQSLVRGRWSTQSEQNALSHKDLRSILDEVLENGLDSRISNNTFLSLFGIKSPCTVRELFRTALTTMDNESKAIFSPHQSEFHRILSAGSLSERVRAALGSDTSPENITAIYNQLAGCLLEGALFNAP